MLVSPPYPGVFLTVGRSPDFFGIEGALISPENFTPQRWVTLSPSERIKSTFCSASGSEIGFRRANRVDRRPKRFAPRNGTALQAPIDKTELKALYDFTLEWNPEPEAFGRSQQL